MAEKIFNQEFKGYWLQKNVLELPNHSGVYIVQAYIYNKEKDNVSLIRLIYIGKADNINDRVNNHEKLVDWKKELKQGEELCYSCTNVSTDYNERVEAALINSNQPIVNVEYKNSFPFDTTVINSNGLFMMLRKKIKVIRH